MIKAKRCFGQRQKSRSKVPAGMNPCSLVRSPFPRHQQCQHQFRHHLESNDNMNFKLATLRSMIRRKQNGCPNNPVNQRMPDYSRILPHLYLGGSGLATDLNNLKRLRITHIVNVAHGTMLGQVPTSATYYKTNKIEFFGIPALDSLSFNISSYFKPAADFIEMAINNGGTVYVHCRMGVSRSATIVIAYLMMKKGLSLVASVQHVQSKRMICPNGNFLTQLCNLEQHLNVNTGM